MCRFTVQPVQAGSQYSQGVRQRSQAASTASTGRQLVQPCSQPARQTLSSHDTVRQRPPAGASARIVFSFSTIRAVGGLKDRVANLGADAAESEPLKISITS